MGPRVLGSIGKRTTVGGLRRPFALMAAGLLGAGLLAACGSSSSSSTTTTAAATSGSGKVLLVGTFNGHAGKYTTIQAAVDAAKTGDWILVAPGDYHENGDAGTTSGSSAVGDGNFGAVLIHTKNLILRGMDRNATIIDGTASTASTPCSRPMTACRSASCRRSRASAIAPRSSPARS